MDIALLVYGSPHSSQASATALRFSKAALAQGHQIYRVFFYGDAVYSANALNTPPQDEADLRSQWQQLAEQHELDLVVCIAAALRRGVINAEEAERFGKTGDNLSQGFTLSGLGQLADASQQADRLVTFGS